jgi:hypothetical protein
MFYVALELQQEREQSLRFVRQESGPLKPLFAQAKNLQNTLRVLHVARR